MIDETLERELFALRATAIATPKLDFADVLARAERPWRAPHRGSRLALTASMIACAAASYAAIVPTPARPFYDPRATTSTFDGLSCRNDMPDLPSRECAGPPSADPATPSDPGMCVAKTQLVCDVTLESSRP